MSHEAHNADTAKHGYTNESEAMIADGRWADQQPRENPVSEPASVPGERPTVAMAHVVDDADALLAEAEGPIDDYEEEVIEMHPSGAQERAAGRDTHHVGAVDESVAEERGLPEHLILDGPEGRRPGETQAQFEERMAEEQDDARRREVARKYRDARERSGGEDGLGLESRAEKARSDAEFMAGQETSAWERRRRNERGLEPGASLSAVKRNDVDEVEGIEELAAKVDERTQCGPARAKALIAREMDNTSNPREAALEAAEGASRVRTVPQPVPEVSPYQHTATVQGEVTHLFEPGMGNQYQVALLKCSITEHTIVFIIHDRARDSRQWEAMQTTHLAEGDVVRVTDAAVHHAQSDERDAKLHATQWTDIARLEAGDGPTTFSPVRTYSSAWPK